MELYGELVPEASQNKNRIYTRDRRRHLGPTGLRVPVCHEVDDTCFIASTPKTQLPWISRWSPINSSAAPINFAAAYTPTVTLHLRQLQSILFLHKPKTTKNPQRVKLRSPEPRSHAIYHGSNDNHRLSGVEQTTSFQNRSRSSCSTRQSSNVLLAHRWQNSEVPNKRSLTSTSRSSRKRSLQRI